MEPTSQIKNRSEPMEDIIARFEQLTEEEKDVIFYLIEMYLSDQK